MVGWFVGKPGFVPTGSLTAAIDRLQADGATVVVVERMGTTIGAIALRDELRSEAAPSSLDLLSGTAARRHAHRRQHGTATAHRMGSRDRRPPL